MMVVSMRGRDVQSWPYDPDMLVLSFGKVSLFDAHEVFSISELFRWCHENLSDAVLLTNLSDEHNKRASPDALLELALNGKDIDPGSLSPVVWVGVRNEQDAVKLVLRWGTTHETLADMVEQIELARIAAED